MAGPGCAPAPRVRVHSAPRARPRRGPRPRPRRAQGQGPAPDGSGLPSGVGRQQARNTFHPSTL